MKREIIRVDHLLGLGGAVRKPLNSSCMQSFEELVPYLSVGLVERLRQLGVHKPTPLQSELLSNYFSHPRTDLFVKAAPGEGKTLAYVMALMSSASLSFATNPLAAALKKQLILVPTAQLASQLAQTITDLDPKTSTSCILNGNCDFTEASIVIAQPEALRTKLAQYGQSMLKGLETVVIDEADALVKPLSQYASLARKRSRAQHPVPVLQLLSEMWGMFEGDPIKKEMKPRLVVTSATLNKRTRQEFTALDKKRDKSIMIGSSDGYKVGRKDSNQVTLNHTLLKDPESVSELIEKFGRIFNEEERGLLLLPAEQSKTGALSLLRAHFPELKFGLLTRDGWKVDDDTHVHVASDVDVRGLNLPGLDYVVILDLPKSVDHFIHMAGRVGRTFNPSGRIYTLLGTPVDLEKYTRMTTQLKLLSVPL